MLHVNHDCNCFKAAGLCFSRVSFHRRVRRRSPGSFTAISLCLTLTQHRAPRGTHPQTGGDSVSGNVGPAADPHPSDPQQKHPSGDLKGYLSGCQLFTGRSTDEGFGRSPRLWHVGSRGADRISREPSHERAGEAPPPQLHPAYESLVRDIKPFSCPFSPRCA